MRTVYSKSNHSETDELSESNKSEIIDTNLDPYDKIKNDIAKRKATKQQPRRKRFAKFPCAVCDRNVNKDAIYCTNCLHWSIASVMGHQSTSVTSYRREQMMCLSIVHYALLNLTLKYFHLPILITLNFKKLNGADLLSQLSLSVPYERL